MSQDLSSDNILYVHPPLHSIHPSLPIHNLLSIHPAIRLSLSPYTYGSLHPSLPLHTPPPSIPPSPDNVTHCCSNSGLFMPSPLPCLPVNFTLSSVCQNQWSLVTFSLCQCIIPSRAFRTGHRYHRQPGRHVQSHLQE